MHHVRTLVPVEVGSDQIYPPVPRMPGSLQAILRTPNVHCEESIYKILIKSDMIKKSFSSKVFNKWYG